MFVKKRRTMFPKSTFEIVIDEEILYFKDVWSYMESGIRGDIISSDDQLELEWEENFENVTTKCDDNLWISYKVPYIKHCWDGLKRMQLLSEMNESHTDRYKRNDERLRLAKLKLRKKQKEKVLSIGRKQYLNNMLYGMKVESLIQYAISAKILHHSMFLHHKYNDFKLGLYIFCQAFSLVNNLIDDNRRAYLCSASILV
jgi:hypothetical protein